MYYGYYMVAVPMNVRWTFKCLQNKFKVLHSMEIQLKFCSSGFNKLNYRWFGQTASIKFNYIHESFFASFIIIIIFILPVILFSTLKTMHVDVPVSKMRTLQNL